MLSIKAIEKIYALLFFANQKKFQGDPFGRSKRKSAAALL
jgi:hypothetical protein